MTNINTVADLVKNDAVSGQFVPRSLSPYILNLTTNQYDSVPLLDSFYAVSNQTDENYNTVGDISFKRHAYEILGWKGWDAFVEYVSDRHSNDKKAFDKILENETEKTWQDFKIKKYETLANKELISQLGTETNLKNKLETAIRADLDIIKNFRSQILPILNSNDTIENKDIEIATLAGKLNIKNNLSNVRKVKEEILKLALKTNDLTDSVLNEKDNSIIYVSSTNKGNGLTINTPTSDLKDALSKVKDGGKIVVVDTLTFREPIIINKQITIEGNGAGTNLILNENPIITADTIIKDLKFTVEPEGVKPSFIKVNNSKLTFTNVDTTIPNLEDRRPTIMLDNSEFVSNGPTELKQIIVNGNSNITLNDRVTKIRDGINAIGSQNSKIISKSNYVYSIIGSDGNINKVDVIFDGVNDNIKLENLNNVSLVNHSRITAEESTEPIIRNKLVVAEHTLFKTLDNSINLKELSGDGNIELDANYNLTAKRLDDTTPHITFINANNPDNKTFVTIENLTNNSEPIVMLSPINKILIKDKDNNWKFRKVIINYSYKENKNDSINEDLTFELPQNEILSDDQSKVLTALENLVDEKTNTTYKFSHWLVNGVKTNLINIPALLLENNLSEDTVAVEGVFIKEIKIENNKDNTTPPNTDNSSNQDNNDNSNGNTTGNEQPETLEEMIPFKRIFVENNNLEYNKQVTEITGQNGINTYQLVNGQKTNIQIKQPKRDEVIQIGTKPSQKTTEIPNKIIYKGNKDLVYVENAEPVITKGQNGLLIETTTYQVNTETGKVTSNTTTRTINAVDDVYTLPIGNTTRFQNIEPETITIDDQKLLKGLSKVINAGEPGIKVFTDTYEIDESTGEITKNTDLLGKITKPVINKEIAIGQLIIRKKSDNPPMEDTLPEKHVELPKVAPAEDALPNFDMSEIKAPELELPKAKKHFEVPQTAPIEEALPEKHVEIPKVAPTEDSLPNFDMSEIKAPELELPKAKKHFEVPQTAPIEDTLPEKHVEIPKVAPTEDTLPNFDMSEIKLPELNIPKLKNHNAISKENSIVHDTKGMDKDGNLVWNSGEEITVKDNGFVSPYVSNHVHENLPKTGDSVLLELVGLGLVSTIGSIVALKRKND